MIILGIESSCDETAAAVIEGQNNRVKLLSNIVASSAQIHAKYGGIIPEQAAREQLKAIIPVIGEALAQAHLTKDQIDTIALTVGPGLIGSLLVGVETAKVLAKVWGKPLIPVNHLIGHFYANWVETESRIKLNSNRLILNIPIFPFIGLLVSGGHTDLILMKDHGKYDYLGGTRDDAAGECFDKCARLLGLPYPGGPYLSKLAEKGNREKFPLTIPMLESGDFDFSFSGLKTAVLNLVQNHPEILLQEQLKADLAASVEWTIVQSLIKKIIPAANKFGVNQIVVSGGVAANNTLREELEKNCKLKIKNCQLYVPPLNLCTDNGAVIATCAYFNHHPQDPLAIQANPGLSL